MLLVGEHKHSVDAKNRLFIPAKYREAMGSTLCIARKIGEDCLTVYTEADWAQLGEALKAKQSSMADVVKQFLFSKSLSVNPDTQGRVVLTPELLAYAGVDKNVAIIGVGDHLEIWSEEKWSEKEASISPEALLAQWRELGF